MKIIISIIIAGLVVTPALAATDKTDSTGPGHYAWIAAPIIGPKSSPPSHHHVWIPDYPVVVQDKRPGHWQWVSEVSFGSRAGAPAHQRIWVSNQ